MGKIKRLINIEELGKIIGRSRSRIGYYVRDGRIPIDFEDGSGRKYWLPETARRIKRLLDRYEAEVGRGRTFGFAFLEPREITRLAKRKARTVVIPLTGKDKV